MTFRVRVEKDEEPVTKAQVDIKELDQIKKDRLDFGFDSIYFRYSEAIEELSWYKEIEARRGNRTFNREAWCDSKRMHFYECLEQLVHAHPEGETNDINY